MTLAAGARLGPTRSSRCRRSGRVQGTGHAARSDSGDQGPAHAFVSVRWEAASAASDTTWSRTAAGFSSSAGFPRSSRIEELNRKFADLEIGFVDAAVVAIAEALGLPRIATTDRSHFGPMAASLSLELLP